jgi:hypothetical protein
VQFGVIFADEYSFSFGFIEDKFADLTDVGLIILAEALDKCAAWVRTGAKKQ